MPIAAALPFIAIGLTMAGTMMQANSEKEQAEAQAEGMRYNANLERQDAEMVRVQAREEEEITRKKYSRLLSSQTVEYAKAGVDLSSGSPLAVLMDQAYEAEKDSLNIRWRGETAVNKKLNSANMMDWNADLTEEAGKTKQITTILKGAGSMAGGLAGSYSGPTTAGLSQDRAAYNRIYGPGGTNEYRGW